MFGRGWDIHLFIRALWLSATTATLALSVIAATEEGGGWPARLALWAVGAPMMGAVGAWVAVRWSRARGEARALETMGVTPARMALGAVVGGTLAGLMGAAIIALGWAEPHALAPPPVGAFDWVPIDGGMLSPSQGIFVASDGVASMVPVTSRAALRLPAWPFALSTGLLAAVLPLWACLPTRASWRMGSAIVASCALAASFHAAMGGVWPALTLLAAPAWLATDAAVRLVRRSKGR